MARPAMSRQLLGCHGFPVADERAVTSMADRPLSDLSFRLPAVANPSENLINLCRASVEAQRVALSQPYTEEGWRPWREAAETFQAAVTAEAAQDPKQSRFELEQAAKKVVLHPELDA